MKHLNEKADDLILSIHDNSLKSLKADCKNCFGFCCVALYFSASESFPVDKEAGRPCINLQSDFNCSVHKDLRKLGLKGCTSYDCFGAGQRTAQVTYGGCDWRQAPEKAKEMFDVFLIMRQIHEMLWYLKESLTLIPADQLEVELKDMLKQTESLTLLSPESLLKLDLSKHGAAVNSLVQKVSELVRSKVCIDKKNPSKRKKILGRGLDLIGVDLRKIDLQGENLRGAYLIAADLRGVDLSGADFLGADLRDADIRGADLSNSIFITQAQINTTKGDFDTKLPNLLARPAHW